MAYTCPKIEVRKSSIEGTGVFTKEAIEKEEIVCDFSGSKGYFFSLKERAEDLHEWNDYDIQVSDDLFFGATKDSELEICDYINHSCDPNCGINGSLKIVAMRTIAADEEITFDYAMSESHKFRLACGCKRTNCREVLTGDDWQIPELQRRYKGYFSQYLQDKIAVNHKK
ncbi:MAG: nuclear protein SET [Parcubacteria group bacterium Gr01-1014_66]|nr:MAG: nuclear protein SET [Parcubacteria group bacterium Gr01-1014_66]